MATAATILVGETRVRVYSTHLGTPADISGAEREEQLRAIVADASRYQHVIIGGDMNDDDVGRAPIESDYCWPTRDGPKTATLGRLDHIFARGLAVSALRSGTGPPARGVSDHRPIWSIAPIPRTDESHSCN